jgi:hypothetical protein
VIPRTGEADPDPIGGSVLQDFVRQHHEAPEHGHKLGRAPGRSGRAMRGEAAGPHGLPRQN